MLILPNYAFSATSSSLSSGLRMLLLSSSPTPVPDSITRAVSVYWAISHRYSFQCRAGTRFANISLISDKANQDQQHELTRAVRTKCTFECPPTSLADVEPDEQRRKYASSTVNVPDLEAQTGAAHGIVQVRQSECDSPCDDLQKEYYRQCQK